MAPAPRITQDTTNYYLTFAIPKALAPAFLAACERRFGTIPPDNPEDMTPPTLMERATWIWRNVWQMLADIWLEGSRQDAVKLVTKQVEADIATIA